MILQALHAHYLRLVQRGGEALPRQGYSQEKISYCLTLSATGEVTAVVPLLDTTGKKPVPRSLSVPQPQKRASGIAPNFLWDKTSYVLGVSSTSKRADKEHAAFKSAHQAWLAGQTDPGLTALLRFLALWTPDQFVGPLFTEDMKDTNLVFRLEGEKLFLHDRQSAFELRTKLMEPTEDGTLWMRCLVTGELAPVARLHPSIKNVDGAQSAGASIVSFNQRSFTSWDKEQGANAPVSDAATFAYTTVLNHLLRRDPSNRQRLTIGDTTLVFWAEAEDPDDAEAAESFFAALTNDRDTDEQATRRVRDALEAIAQGRPLSDVDTRLKPDTRMAILGLAPNSSRLSVRYWLQDSLGVLAKRLSLHTQDLRLEPVPWRTPPPPRRLALCTAPSRDGKHSSDDVSPLLAGEFMRAILTGGRYPQSLLANLLIRMRSDGHIDPMRVALCKAVISRDLRLSESKTPTKEVPVSLDTQVTQPAYLLGRLFAVLEGAQRAALGGNVNATIRDRYFGAASATPALVFPMLLRNAQNHLSRLRKDKVGLAVSIEKDLQEVIDKLPDHFPKSLDLKDQGRFAIGYYHQTSARYASKDEAPTQASNT